MTWTYRLTRGFAVVVAIVVTHFLLAWLFDKMKLRAPDLGPVFATILVEEPSADSKSAPPKREREPEPARPADSRPRD